MIETRARLSSSPVIIALTVASLVVMSAGCGKPAKPTTQPTKLSDRTDKALDDPFGYSPSFDRTDISGGNAGHFDRQGMKKDLDHVLNP